MNAHRVKGYRRPLDTAPVLKTACTARMFNASSASCRCRTGGQILQFAVKKGWWAMRRLTKALPLWKIGHEIRRLARQVRAAPGSLATYIFGAKYYDIVHSGKVLRTNGRIGASGKVAVYLIYPMYGVQSSHLRGLKYLVSKGYAPVIVSNLPLDVDDRDRLLGLCYICLERPNFGYDFGGYRDGVLALEADLSRLDYLLLINDSTWFALPGCRDWLRDAEALNVDLAAAASNFGVPRAGVEDFGEIVWDYRTTHKNFHFCSFSLLFSNRVLADPDFRRFWKRFPLTNKKNRTVRRGEIGLSKWIIAHGFTHGVTCEVTRLDKALAELGDAHLRQVADDLIVPEDSRLLRLKHEVLKDNPGRRDLIQLILHAVARQGSSYALAAYTINLCGFPFLKKSPVWLSQDASDITLRLASGLPGQVGAEILSEAKALRLARAPDFDRQE